MKWIILTLLILSPGIALATTDCQDPKGLTPELKKAYYQLKEIAKEIEGMDVKIRCTKHIGTVIKYKKK